MEELNYPKMEPTKSEEKENRGADGFSTPTKSEASTSRLPVATKWLPALVSSKHFFHPCEHCLAKGSGTESHKATVNYLCLTCADVRGVCQLCMHEHANHHILQIRRSSYHDVVRERELSKLISTKGIQTYIINSSQVVFLRERPQSRNKSHAGASARGGGGGGGGRGAGARNGRHLEPLDGNQPGGCLVCGRHLHEGLSYCSLGCKVKHCTRGAPLGKQLPPGLELENKPQGTSYWVDFQPHTPQLKPKSPSYGSKSKKKKSGGHGAADHLSGAVAKAEGQGSGTGVKSLPFLLSHGYYYTTQGAPQRSYLQRHRRKKTLPKQAPVM
mmetsp:Transcript_24215/g.52070  ORF Transcript_24215/g.52070 Transcript_24215/m.52070 type:complete len:328 (+) Transcript_24215:728-1711(+)